MKTTVEHPAGRFYQFGRFRIEVDQCLLLRDGKPLPLSARAFDTLLILVRRRTQTVDNQELLDIIWPGTAMQENNLTQVISTLRTGSARTPTDALTLRRCRGGVIASSVRSAAGPSRTNKRPSHERTFPRH